MGTKKKHLSINDIKGLLIYFKGREQTFDFFIYYLAKQNQNNSIIF